MPSAIEHNRNQESTPVRATSASDGSRLVSRDHSLTLPRIDGMGIVAGRQCPTGCYPDAMDEQPRPVANRDEQAYTLTVDEAAALYEQAGFARTMRAIQKYCARGDLDCIREQTTYGERFRIKPASVARHIEQIEQLSQANRRDHSRPDANVRTNSIEPALPQNDEPSVREQPRPDGVDNRYVGQLESENAFLRDQIGRKDRQIEQRDNQIEAMIERDRETNILIEQLQRRIPLPEGRRSDDAMPTPHAELPSDTEAVG